MYKGTAGDQVFRFPTKWDEITVKQFAKYQKLLVDLRKNFVVKFGLKDESEVDKITNVEILRKYPDYFIKIFCFWTGLKQTKAFRS